MKRGDIVLVALSGDYGKPRPAVVLQDDLLTLAVGLGSVVVCPLTSQVTGARSFRVAIEPSSENGLTLPSEVMVEKLAGVSVKRVREVIGRVDQATMHGIERALLLVLGFASRSTEAS